MASAARVVTRRAGPPGWDRRAGGRRLALLLVFLSGVAALRAGEPEAPVSPAPAALPETPPHVWLDAEGEPLPFQSDAEILEFLRTAPVVSRTRIPAGINRPEKLLLEKNGTRAHAAFRVVDVDLKQRRVGPRFYFRFRDWYMNECAAYALARRLGLESVPPAVPRRLDGTDGSVQIWVENTRDEQSQEFKPPNVLAWVSQVWDKDLFDNLILNVDRNAGNVLVGQQYRLWLIDHTRAFQPERELLDPERVARVRRAVWDRLLALSEEDLKDALGDYLDSGQMSALVKRRTLLIEHVEKLVAERGEAAVFY